MNLPNKILILILRFKNIIQVINVKKKNEFMFSLIYRLYSSGINYLYFTFLLHMLYNIIVYFFYLFICIFLIAM